MRKAYDPSAETAKASKKQSRRRKPNLNHSKAEKERFPGSQSGYLGWKNVAVELEADSSATTGNVGRHLGVQRVHSARSDRTAMGRSGSISMRSKTSPERPRHYTVRTAKS